MQPKKFVLWELGGTTVLSDTPGRRELRQGLECASPLALCQPLEMSCMQNFALRLRTSREKSRRGILNDEKALL